MTNYLELIPYIFTYFYKRYGLRKTIKGIYYYHFNIINQSKLPFLKKELLEINGHPLSIIPGDKGISAQLLLYKTHEPLATQILTQVLREGMTCIDIGSNIGYYACLESKLVGTFGQVIAIEPSPKNFEFLKKNLKLQPIHNYQSFNFACGDSNGVTDFFVSDRSNWSRVVNNDEQRAVGDKTEIIKVKLTTLDAFVQEQKFEKIDLIRMDVEGYEIDVYSGMKETIKKFNPMIQIEIHNIFLGSEKTVNLLKNFRNDGYEIKYFIPQDMDLPIIGEIGDVKQITINELLKMNQNQKLPKIFQVFLSKKIF